MGWVMVVMPVLMLVFGFPLFLVLLATVAVALTFFASVPTTAIHQVLFGSIDKYALIAVPFFVFAGDLLGHGGVSIRLVRWVQAVIGGVRGSLAFTSLGAAAVFSAISGSTAATVAAVGGLTYGRLRTAGYSERFSTGLLIAAGAIDNLIPPSIGFILFGIASDTSIVKLFAAGLIPGVVLSVFYAVYIYLHVRKSDALRGAPFRVAELAAATRDGIWAIAAPVVILGGIYAGVFSPTEAAGIACVYAIFVSMFIYREADARQVFETAYRSLYLTGQIFIIVACAGVYSWLLTVSGVASAVVATINGWQLPPWAILLTINVLLLFVGMFLDTASSILVLTPLLAPIAKAAGIDPVHFGVMMVMNLSIGTFTPPFGVNIFVGQAVFRAPLSSIYPGLLPFIIAAVGALMVVTYIPQLSLWILRFV